MSGDDHNNTTKTRVVLRVLSSEVAGPSGAGSRAESLARTPRPPSGIRLSTPSRGEVAS